MPRAHSRRSKVLDYLAGQGGELRSDSGLGLRRQIAEALGERPTVVGQTLVALEKAGLVHRELDVQRQRCFAIRLSPAVRPLVSEIDLADESAPAPEPEPETNTDTDTDRRRLAADLDAARLDLKEAILRASRLSRRVRDLEWAMWRADQRQPVSP
jgi:DNA-binding MarR family transcriptional regulator